MILIHLHPLSQRSGRMAQLVKRSIAASRLEVLPDGTSPKVKEIDLAVNSNLIVDLPTDKATTPLEPVIELPIIDASTADSVAAEDNVINDMGIDEPVIPDLQERLTQQMQDLAQKLRLIPDSEPSHPLLKRLHQSGHWVSRAIAVPYWRDIPLPRWPVICLSLAGFCGGVGLAAVVGILSLSPSAPNCQVSGAGCPDSAKIQADVFQPLSDEERDNFWVEQADVLKTAQTPNQPLYQYLATLWVTRSQLQKPVAISPAKTAGQVKHLEQQIQDLTQLQLAQLLAGLYQAPTMQAAIQIAQTVTPDRPYYAYAQTLIHHWQQVSQQAEDRPYLQTAQRLALTGKVEDLKAAIAEAQQVPIGRASRGEAQALIFRWTRQVQTLEDRPILEQARTLAQQTKLEDAIRVASQISPGRAFSETAQSLVNDWSHQLYSSKDRATLDQATALADQLYLSRAIDLAAQIPAESPLYKEAQAAIADWTMRRTEFWKARAAETTEAADPSTPELAVQTDTPQTR